MNQTQYLIKLLREFSEEEECNVGNARTKNLKGYYEGKSWAYSFCADWLEYRMKFDGIYQQEDDEGVEEGEEEDERVPSPVDVFPKAFPFRNDPEAR
uniref:Uncharacterized protein n=1 Tax=viral metagenome TaxID=1070528 RepID=A0A6H1ZXT5_9ZZZZ